MIGEPNTTACRISYCTHCLFWICIKLFFLQRKKAWKAYLKSSPGGNQMHQFAEALTEHGLKILSKLPRFCVKILNNKIKAIDSSYSMYVFIDDYEKEVQSLLNLRHF